MWYTCLQIRHLHACPVWHVAMRKALLCLDSMLCARKLVEGKIEGREGEKRENERGGEERENERRGEGK